MSVQEPTDNPITNSFDGLHDSIQLDRDHPVANILLTSTIQACYRYQQGTELKVAIKSILTQIRQQYGEETLEELVKSAVTLTYAQQSVLHPSGKLKVLDIAIAVDCKFISDWLLFSRRTRAPVDIKTYELWPEYPKAVINGTAAGSCTWYCDHVIKDNMTRNELFAEVVETLMGSPFIVRGAIIRWSKSERIFIVKASHPFFQLWGYPHIKTYDCIMYYPETATQESLVEDATQFASTWCPMACVVLSAEESIQPGRSDGDGNGNYGCLTEV